MIKTKSVQSVIRLSLLQNRKIRWLSQDVDNCRRQSNSNDDQSRDCGCVVRHAAENGSPNNISAIVKECKQARWSRRTHQPCETKQQLKRRAMAKASNRQETQWLPKKALSTGPHERGALPSFKTWSGPTPRAFWQRWIVSPHPINLSLHVRPST